MANVKAQLPFLNLKRLALRGFFLGLVVIGPLWLGWTSLRAVGFEGHTRDIIAPGELQEVKGETTIGQSFLASRDGLNRIDVLLLDYHRVNTHDVTFHLRQGNEAQEDIFTATFNASEVRGLTWKSFSFPPLTDSAGKEYFFFFESPESTRGNAITVGGAEGDPYSHGNAFLKSNPVNADAAFKTYYDVSLQQKFGVLSDRLAGSKPSVWGDKRFYLLLVVAYGLLMAALIWYLG
jgi:hypothetical protein